MYNKLAKHGQALAFGLGLLISIIFIVVALSGVENFDALDKAHQGETTIFDFGLKAAIFLTAVAFIIMFAWGLYHVALNLKKSWVGVAGFGVILVIFLIGYSTAQMETTGHIVSTFEKMDVNAWENKIITGGIGTAIVMSGVALVTFVGSELINLFK